MNNDFENLIQYISSLISKESGNILGDNQKSMVRNRISKRLLDLKMDVGKYRSYLDSNFDAEMEVLTSLLTTHHTFFFREFIHYNYLIESIPTLVEGLKRQNRSVLNILSAACSRGQEVYSLAMLLDHHLKEYPEISYKILGTDIDTESIKIAKNGVYPFHEVKAIPSLYLEGNWQKGTGNISRFAKVKTHLKEKCSFKKMNLLEPAEVLGDQKFDVMFCRNVYIYFDQKTVKQSVISLKKHMHSNSIFVTGVSESLSFLDVYKRSLAPSVYSFFKGEDTPEAFNTKQNTRKVLIVDDSSAIRKLMSRIIDSTPGLEVAGLAKNGVEAHDFMLSNKVDLMTLDIHMPLLNGIEYLRKYYNDDHPPVVMVSSASREDTTFAQEAINLGANDYVEKPSFDNLDKAKVEISNKLLMVSKKTRMEKSSFGELKVDGVKSQTKRIFIGSELDIKKAEIVIRESQIKAESYFICSTRSVGDTKYEAFSILNEQEGANIIESEASPTVFVFSGVTSLLFNQLVKKKSVVIFVDEHKGDLRLSNIAKDVFPWSSFAHLGDEMITRIQSAV